MVPPVTCYNLKPCEGMQKGTKYSRAIKLGGASLRTCEFYIIDAYETADK